MIGIIFFLITIMNRKWGGLWKSGKLLGYRLMLKLVKVDKKATGPIKPHLIFPSSQYKHYLQQCLKSEDSVYLSGSGFP